MVPVCPVLSWVEHWKSHILGNLSVPEKLGHSPTCPFAVGKSAVHSLTACWQPGGFTCFKDNEPKIQQVKHPLRITQLEGSKERSWIKDSRFYFSTPAALGTVTWKPSDWEGEGHVLDTLQHCKHFSGVIIHKYTLWSQAPGAKGLVLILLLTLCREVAQPAISPEPDPDPTHQGQKSYKLRSEDGSEDETQVQSRTWGNPGKDEAGKGKG